MRRLNLRIFKNKWNNTPTFERRLFAVFCTIFLALFLFSIVLTAPRGFISHTIIRIEKGENLSNVANKLSESGYIKSKTIYKIFTFLNGRGGVVYAGDYFFEKPLTVMTVAHRIATQDEHLMPERITVQEGLNKFQIAELFASQFNIFSVEEFEKVANEGYLFPDTYFFLPNAGSSEVARRMEDNFMEQTKDLDEKIKNAEYSLNEIITMASIIEKEANTPESRRIVSGILWKRLEMDMALQVDATFAYVNGKNTYTLSLEDLEDESPYNTYINTGLPPGPISNPGLDSIIAAVEPEETDYLYFLHDLSGKIYYAEDFDGHQRNRELYLRR